MAQQNSHFHFAPRPEIVECVQGYGQGSFGTQQLTQKGASHPDEFGGKKVNSLQNLVHDKSEDDDTEDIKPTTIFGGKCMLSLDI